MPFQTLILTYDSPHPPTTDSLRYVIDNVISSRMVELESEYGVMYMYLVLQKFASLNTTEQTIPAPKTWNSYHPHGNFHIWLVIDMNLP